MTIDSGQTDALGRRIEYRALADLRANPRNPKSHSDETITDSIGRFGYIEPVVLDGRTGYIVSGHGRTDALRRAEASKPSSPPDGILVGPDGVWRVPVVVGWDSSDDLEATAALIALNRTTELGGWVDEVLLEALDVLGDVDGGLTGVGYTEADIEALRLVLNPGDEDHPEYTRKADVPQYTPRDGEPPEPWELVDTSRTLELVHRITETEGLDLETRSFLIAAAHRHTVFRYSKVADFYAHQSPEVQALMEESALVIIDSADAIQHGYVRLTERMSAILGTDTDDDLGDADA